MRKFKMPFPPLLSKSEKRPRLISVVPSLFTLGNAVCGFACITYAAKVGPETATTHNLYFAALLLFGAMVFDGIDGPMARLAKQTSEFGAQLDSLADAISFGVAPAFLMLTFSRVFHPRILWVIAVLYVLCAVLRLARFNVAKADDQWKSSFCGLPSPAAAGMVASLVIAGPGLARQIDDTKSESMKQVGQILIQMSEYALPIVTFLVACLMVSRIRYPKLASELLRRRRTYRHVVNLIFVSVAVFAFYELALPLTLFLYVVASPIRALVHKLWPRPAQPAAN